jgi:hypothetical protein
MMILDGGGGGGSGEGSDGGGFWCGAVSLARPSGSVISPDPIRFLNFLGLVVPYSE